MSILAAALTGGFIVGLVVLGVCVLVCLGVGVSTLVHMWDYDPIFGWFVFGGSLVAVAICVGVWWWGSAFTLSGDYHRWNPKEGRVQRVNKRIVSDGDNGISQRFVVVIAGQPYGVDDTRAALLRPGDYVKLLCKKDYQWGVPRSAHGWACRWNGTGR